MTRRTPSTWRESLFARQSASGILKGGIVRRLVRRGREIRQEDVLVAPPRISASRLRQFETFGDRAPLSSRQKNELYKYYARLNYHTLRSQGFNAKDAWSHRAASPEKLNLLKKKYDAVVDAIARARIKEARDAGTRVTDLKRLKKAIRSSISRSKIKEKEWKSYMQKRGYDVRFMPTEAKLARKAWKRKRRILRRVEEELSRLKRPTARPAPAQKPVRPVRPVRKIPVKPARKASVKPARKASVKPARKAARPVRRVRKVSAKPVRRRRNPFAFSEETWD